MGNIQYYGKSRKGRKLVKKANKRIRGKYYAVKAGPLSLTSPAMYTKIRYRQKLTLTASTTFQYNVFRLNSPYDPDYSGVGGQPMGFDQLAALYNKFTVYGCKVVVTCAQVGAVPTTVVMAPQKVVSYGTATPDELQERRLSVSRKCTAERPCVLKRYYPMSGLFGVSKRDILGDEGDFASSSSASPTKNFYLLVGQQPVDSASGTSVYMDVELTYYLKAFENKALARS